MTRARAAILLGVAALLLATVAPSPAATHTVSYSESCTVVSCQYQTYMTQTHSIPVDAPSHTIPPFCAAVVGGVCVAGVQGDPSKPPGSGPGVTVTVDPAGPGVSVTLAICNNKTTPTVPATHCPGTTRVQITIVRPDAAPPAVTVSRTCAVVNGGLPVPCQDYP